MNKYMSIANSLAEENLESKNGGPFGACVVKDDKVIGKGANCVLKNNDPTAHAEIMAIRDACKNLKTYDLEGCELYTTCYPCPMCLSVIIWSNIKTVYYGNTAKDAAKIGFRDDLIYKYIDELCDGINNDDILKLIKIDRKETIETFKEYENMDDKTIY